MKKGFFLFAIAIILTTSLVLASNPQHHLYISERVCTESNPTQIQQIACGENFDAFIMGNIFIDHTVPKYFTEFVKYSNSHSPSLCQQLINLAGTDPRKLAFSYGACFHQASIDTISHNIYVPPILQKTALTNAMGHALAEEAANDILLERDPQLRNRLNELLRGQNGIAFEEFNGFYKTALQQNPLFQDENIDANIDFLMTQVIGSGSRYEHGFGSAFVIPLEIWLVMGLVLLITVISSMIILFRRKNLLNWITLVILLIPIIFIGLAIYGLFSGNLFTMYQTISAPITNILPIGNIDDHIDLQVQNGIAFFNQGSSFMTQVDDPTGIESLKAGEDAGKTLRWIVGMIIVLLLGGLVALNIFFSPKNNKKRD